jgi:membrane fusion protein (multidrug efflux system)
MSRTKALALILLVLSVAGLAYWRSMQSTGQPVTPAPAAQPARPPTGVRVAVVWRETIDEDLQAVGSLLADEAIVLRPEIAGRIEAIRFSEGARVAAGDVLFELNASENRAMLAQTEAQQLLDRQNFERVKEMRQKNLASAQQYDEVLAKLKYSNASVDKERIRLEKMVLRAPFAGVVGLRQVAIGDYVTEGQALVNLEALNPIKLDFKLPERYAAFVRVGLPLTIKVEAYPGRDFGGVVYAIDPRLDEATRTLKVRARLPNESLLLKPGMFATIRLGLKGTRNALFVPEQSVMMKGSDAYVYRLADGKAVLTPVNTGLRRKGNVEVSSGLTAGDRVVTDGQTKLRDGVPVSIVDGSADSP